MHHGLAGELHWLLERLGDVGHHVGAAIGKALIGEEPGRPGCVIGCDDGSRTIRNRICRVGDVFIELSASRRWSLKRKLAAVRKIKRLGDDGATVLTTLRENV